jgi:hypothetical protein
MYFPILHIINVGTLYRQTDGRTDDSLILLVESSAETLHPAALVFLHVPPILIIGRLRLS